MTTVELRGIVARGRHGVAPDERRVTVRLFAQGGAVGIVRLTESGAPIFVPVERVRNHRNRDLCGTYRWYNEYRWRTSWRRR